MKKVFAIFLCLTCLLTTLSLFSCDIFAPSDPTRLAGKTPEEVYTAAQVKLVSCTRFRAETAQDITMVYAGVTYTIQQSVTSVVDGQNSYFRSSATNIDNTKIATEAWYVDGILYNASSKLWAEYSWERYVEDYLGGNPNSSMLLNIPTDWFENVTFERKSGSSGYFMVFEIAGEKYEEMFNEIGGSVAGTDLSDVVYTVEFDKKGNLVSILTEFDMTLQGAQASCVSKSMIYTDNVPAVTAPADKDTYMQGYIR